MNDAPTQDLNDIRDRLLQRLTTHFASDLGIGGALIAGDLTSALCLATVSSMDAGLRHPEWGRTITNLLLAPLDEEQRATWAERIVANVPVGVSDER